MKTALFIFFACCAIASADEDRLARATYFHIKVILPAPYRTGEIVAEASYDRKNEIMYFRSLTVKTGSQSIKVPKRILRFFIGPRFTSLQLLYGPPDTGLYGPPATGGSKKPGYFKVTFKYQSYPYEGLFDAPERPMASIIVRDGVITTLYREEYSEKEGYKMLEYNPKTLKEITHPRP